MSGYTGKDTSISWIYSGGTIQVDLKYRSVNYNPDISLLDQSGGADTHKSYIAGQKDGTFSFTGVAQSGGTVLMTALARGTGGTIIYGPEGTAAGKPKTTIPAISKGARLNVQYDVLTEISCELQQNGSETDGAF